MKHQRLTYPDVARIVGTGLISTGLGLLFFVFVTVAWGDPFTRISEHGAQEQLARQFSARFDADTTALEQNVLLDSRTTRAQARRYRRSLKKGEVSARLSIPKIGLKKYVVKGAGVPELKKGPGFYDETGFPGSGLPVAVAGHRTTHGAPFLNVDRLRPGDRIFLDMPYGRFEYQVTRTQIITPSDWSIVDIGAVEPNRRLGRRELRSGVCEGTCEHLVMTACHPKYSARQRIAVFSRLVRVSLRGNAG